MTTESVTHTAGTPAQLPQGRVIQRCAACGGLLVDNLYAAPSDRPAAPPTYPVGTAVHEVLVRQRWFHTDPLFDGPKCYEEHPVGKG